MEHKRFSIPKYIWVFDCRLGPEETEQDMMVKKLARVSKTLSRRKGSDQGQTLRPFDPKNPTETET